MKPDNKSGDMAAMEAPWAQVAAILGGARAMREAGETYLPKFEVETDKAYELRRKHARFTNIFGDVVENLAQRPFSDPVAISDEADPQLVTFCDDVDGRGNNLHVFAGGMFHDAIAYGIDWLLVDYPNAPAGPRTVAQERESGIRPVWCRYAARDVLAVYSERLGGVEHIVHARLAETAVVRDGFEEAIKRRVRVMEREVVTDATGQVTALGPAAWTLYEKQKDEKTGKEEWREISGGAFTIGIIPLVPLVMGRRTGWKVKPPMDAVSDLQIEYYQQENGLKNTKNLTAFPMLSGDGVEPLVGDDNKPLPLTVGPATVLFAPDGGAWRFISPEPGCLNFLKDDMGALAREIRELGRQPLTAQSGNLTAITTAFAAQKGNSAVQAWALMLKDALEQALRITSTWLKVDASKASVTIKTDFDADLGEGDDFAHVTAMFEAEVIDADTYEHEAKRRGILDPDRDSHATDFTDDGEEEAA